MEKKKKKRKKKKVFCPDVLCYAQCVLCLVYTLLNIYIMHKQNHTFADEHNPLPITPFSI